MKTIFLFILIVLTDIQTGLSQEKSSSWSSAKKSRKGAITVFWFPNSPFSFKDSKGELKGIEVDLVNGFQKYLQTHYKIDLTIDWSQQKTFKDVLALMKSDRVGSFGTAGFSFSEERKSFMKFSPSYMADIAVLVSTPDIPIVKSGYDLKKYLSGTTALTAEGTLLEKELIQLRDENSIPFKIEYTGPNKELIELLKTRKRCFGYLNLPVYLTNLDKSAINLNRQSYLTKRYEGRGIGMPKVSDWDLPLNEYFASSEFKQDIEPIIAKYVNIDLYHFLETFNPQNEVSLLNKEKDIQQMKLTVQELIIRDKNRERIYLILIISIVTVLLIAIGVLFSRQIRDHRLLKEQKAEIEAQSDYIHSINDNLEMTILERTRELETKNKALEEYAFITAHKLRAPLASILGLVYLIDKMEISQKDRIVIDHLNQSAKKLDEVVHSVMEAIDGEG